MFVLNEVVHRDLKIAAVVEKNTMSKIVEVAINEYLLRKKVNVNSQ